MDRAEHAEAAASLVSASTSFLDWEDYSGVHVDRRSTRERLRRAADSGAFLRIVTEGVTLQESLQKLRMEPECRTGVSDRPEGCSPGFEVPLTGKPLGAAS